MSVLKIVTWTPSRFAKWKECPAKVKYEDLMKLCPVCFKGKLSGGYDGEPVKCDTCDGAQPEREALERGSRLDAALSASLERGPGRLATDGSYAEATRHPAVAALVRKLQTAKRVVQQASIVLDATWRPVSQYTKGAWARLKLDVLKISGKKAEVIDWKSGNIDKAKGIIRERPEYTDSMRAYQLATLAAHPAVSSAEATMVFIDAPPKLKDPTKSLPVLKRQDFDAAKAAWEKKISPMLADTRLVPRPGYYCNWCNFSKRRGGPCAF